MAHESVCLVLLYSYPDTVHRFPSHETPAHAQYSIRRGILSRMSTGGGGGGRMRQGDEMER